MAGSSLRVAEYVEENTGISAYSYGWCGHIVHYNPEETTKAINAVLASREVPWVIPVLVAYDEMFQKNIIGRGIKAIENNEAKMVYRPIRSCPTATLPNGSSASATAPRRSEISSAILGRSNGEAAALLA